jgi:hypothetical protein
MCAPRRRPPTVWARRWSPKWSSGCWRELDRRRRRCSGRRCAAVAAIDPRTAEDRHHEANKGKTVRLCPLPDAMAGIWSVHTAIDAEAILARLRDLTTTATTTGPGDERGVDERGVDERGVDERGVDARRADVLRDLILSHRVGNRVGDGDGVGGGAPGRSGAGRMHVQLLIPAAVADWSSNGPGELVGYGPIPASLCREAIHRPGTAVEPVHLDERGQVIAPTDVDTHRDRYRPSAQQARYLHIQWTTCRFPGCNRRAARCDLDHLIPFDGTNTIAANLQPVGCASCSRPRSRTQRKTRITSDSRHAVPRVTSTACRRCRPRSAPGRAKLPDRRSAGRSDISCPVPSCASPRAEAICRAA